MSRLETNICFPAVRERSQEKCLRETCEASLLLTHHPRSSLSLVLQVLHDDGSVSFTKSLCVTWTETFRWSLLFFACFVSLSAPQLLSCCLNAACMALMDAGLPMRCLFCGITCAISADGDIITDPTAAQEKVSPGGNFLSCDYK